MVSKKFLIVVSIVLVFVSFICGCSQGSSYKSPLKAQGVPKAFTKNGTRPPDLEIDGVKYKYNDNVSTLLIMGIDKTDDRDMLGVGYCNDVNMLVVYDSSENKVTTINLSRDILTDIAVFNKEGKYDQTIQGQLALAHAYGRMYSFAPDVAADAVSRILGGVPVTKYVTIDVDGIIPIADAVGGVTVTSLDDFTSHGIGVGVGTEVTLTSDMAEYYLRDRQIPGMSGLNSDRMKRQSQFLGAFKDTLINKIKEDPSVIKNVVNAADGHVKHNLSAADMLFFGGVLMDNGFGEVIEVSGPLTHYNDFVGEVYEADPGTINQLVVDLFYKPVE